VKDVMVEKILPGGEALVRSGDQVVLVANGVPGDKLDVQVLQKRRGVLRGTIERVIEAGDQRVEPPCPVAAECGGCALQFVHEQVHAALKSDWVHDAFVDLIEHDTEWLPADMTAAASRRRVRWVVGRDEQGLFAGFYAHASHRIIRHASCMVLTPTLSEVHALLPALLSDAMQGVQAVEVSDGIHIIIETDQEIQPETDPLPAALSDGTALQWWWRHEGITRPLTRPAQRFHDALPAGDGEVLLRVGPDDFVQGQQAGNARLIARIQQWAGKPRRIADLFCGIGNLSLPLAAATGATLYGAELNPASVKAAAANAKALAVDARFVTANLFEDFDMEPYIGVDVLILDPPRRGARRICSRINRLLPEKIMMISCDPAAGARDGAILKQQGYRLQALQALDLFAYAGHVEALSLWVKG